jgi:DNA-binding GntR family transcriptional regulator
MTGVPSAKGAADGKHAPPRRADLVRDALADDIIAGRLRAGARLDETSLARRFQVSRTPVREALRELAASGLAESRAHVGAVVATMTEARFHDIFEAVAELEAVCARLAAIKMSAGERYGLEEIHRQCGRLVQSGDTELYHAANAEFHAAIRQGSQNVVLQEMVGTLRRRFAPLSRSQFRSAGRLAASYAEHDQVVRAIMRGDGEQAFHTMRRHHSGVRRSFAEYAAAQMASQAAE